MIFLIQIFKRLHLHNYMVVFKGNFQFSTYLLLNSNRNIQIFRCRNLNMKIVYRMEVYVLLVVVQNHIFHKLFILFSDILHHSLQDLNILQEIFITLFVSNNILEYDFIRQL